MSRAFSVAKELVKLSLAGDEADPLTNLRLQKLLYYAQAWSLVVRDSELFPEEVRAWRYGPVVEEVFEAMPDGSRDAVVAEGQFANVADLLPEEAVFVRRVWESYKEYSASRLSEMTHQERPWKKAWGNRPEDGPGNEPILIEDMEAFFTRHAMPCELAEYAHLQRRNEEAASRRLTERPPLDTRRLLAISTMAGE